MLVRNEMESSHFPMPAPAEIAPALEKLKNGFPSEEDYRAALAEYGIAEEDIGGLLLRMAAIEEFTSLRFRPAVQVTEQEVQDYFDRVVAPAARAAHPGQPVELETYRAQIEEKLAAERADRDLDNWLKEARRRTQVTIHQEAFE